MALFQGASIRGPSFGDHGRDATRFGPPAITAVQSPRPASRSARTTSSRRRGKQQEPKTKQRRRALAISSVCLLRLVCFCFCIEGGRERRGFDEGQANQCGDEVARGQRKGSAVQ